MGLNGCNDLIYRVVTFLYKRVGNEKATVCFQFVAFECRISNNLTQDMQNFRARQIIENDEGIRNCLKIIENKCYSNN